MDFPDINILAVVAATVVSIVLGSIWFSPPVFFTIWLNAIGKTRETVGRPAVAMPFVIAGAFVFAIGIAVVYGWMGRSGWATGLGAGVFLYLVTILPLKISDILLEGRRLALFWVTAGFYLVDFALMGVAIGLIS